MTDEELARLKRMAVAAEDYMAGPPRKTKEDIIGNYFGSFGPIVALALIAEVERLRGELTGVREHGRDLVMQNIYLDKDRSATIERLRLDLDAAWAEARAECVNWLLESGDSHCEFAGAKLRYAKVPK